MTQSMVSETLIPPSRIRATIAMLIDYLDSIESDPDLEDCGDDESYLAGDYCGQELEFDEAERGIGDHDGLVEQGGSVYEMAQ